MSFKEQLTIDMRKAMKARDSERVSVLRMVLSSLSNEAIAMKKKEEGLTEEEELLVLNREARRRREAASEYDKGERDEQAAAERRELEIIQTYLPKKMSDDELRSIVSSVIKETGVSEFRDMGRVMGIVMGKVKGRADGNAVREIVDELLST